MTDTFCWKCGGPGPAGIDAMCAACRLREIESLVPAEFMATDPARLNQAKLKEVLEWVPGAKGLVIMGESGVGKTRCMWELLKRWVTPDDVVFSPGSRSFANRLAIAYREGVAELWFRALATCRIFAIDDITKLKMTERVEAELFGLIDERCNNHRPVIVTMQGRSGNDLSSSLSADRGQPLVRRLREFCRVVDFSE